MNVPPFDRDAQRKRWHQAMLRMGGPIFVPTGRRFAKWRMSGLGGAHLQREGGAANRVSVSTHWSRSDRRLEVQTSVEDHHLPDCALVAQVLSSAVVGPVDFPLTLTVSRRTIDIPLDGAALEVDVFEAGEAWIAVGSSADRGIQIQGRGIAVDEVGLRTVLDITSLPEERWLR